MPDIAIRQILNDSSFRKGLSENAANIRNWGKEAEKVFQSTRTPMERFELELAKVEKLYKDGYIAADAYTRKVQQLQEQFAKTTAVAPVKAELVKPAAIASPLGGQLSNLAGDIGGRVGIPMAGALAGAAAGPVGAIGAAASAAVMWAKAVADAAEKMDDAADSADKLGVSLDVFLRMEVAAKKAHVGVEALSSGMLKMQRNAATALTEGGGSAKALGELGLDPARLMAQSPDEAFQTIARSLENVENKFQRTRLEMELFGKSGAELDQVLKQAAEGFDSLGKFTPDPAAARGLAELGENLETVKLAAAAAAMELSGINSVGRLRVAIDWAYEKIGITQPQEPTADVPEETKARLIQADAARDKAKQLRGDLDEAFGKLHSGGDPWAEKLKQLEAMGPAGDLAARELKGMADALNQEQQAVAASAAMQKDFDGCLKAAADAIAKYKAELAGLPDYQPALDKFAGTEKYTEIKQALEEQAKLAKEVADQRRADNAAQQWEGRMKAATTDADELAASLIAGSERFAGNMQAALKFVQGVKAAERERQVSDAATRFEGSMRDQFGAHRGESSQQAQLRKLTEQGLDPERAIGLAGKVAELDAMAAGKQMSRLAPSASYGSHEAYNIIAQAQQNKTANSPEALQTRTNQILERLLAEIRSTRREAARVAPAP